MNNTGIVLIGIGLACDLLGCIGLLRFPDIYTRLQASTKCVTFGTCLLLLGSACILHFNTAGIKCVLAILFLIVTVPTSSHAIARAAHKAGVKLCDGSTCDEYSKRKAS